MKLLSKVIKIGCSAAFLFIIFYKVNFRELLPLLGHINYFYLILALLVVFFETVLAGYRWALVMSSLNAGYASRFYIKIYLIGVYFNQILPTSIGGDGYRMLETYRHTNSKKMALNGVLSDRIIGSLGLLILTLLCLLPAHSVLTKPQFLMSALITFLGIGSVTVIYFLRQIKINLFLRYFSWLFILSETFHNACGSKKSCLFKIIISIVTNASAALAVYFISHALGLRISFLDFLIIMPYVCLFMMLPISIAGWGLREGVMIGLGTSIGMSVPEALVVSILYGLISILASAPGLLLFLSNKRPSSLRTAVL